MTEEISTNTHYKGRVAAFLSGQAFSIFGTMLVQYAIIFHLTLVYQSGVISMITTLCAILPQIIVSVFAGAVADRWNRKMLIIFADTMTAVATLALAIIFISGYQELWLLFTVMIVRSIGSGIQSPAVTAFIPQITPKEKLLKINGINGSIQSLAMLVSPVLAAAVLAVFSIEIIFFIDVVTAIAAVLITFFIRAPKLVREDSGVSYFKDIKNGIKYIIKEKPLLSFMVVWALFMFLLTPVMILPSLYIARVFGNAEWRLALNEVLFAVGALISGILMSTWGGFKSKLKTLVIGCMIFSVFTLLLGLGQNTFTLVLGKPVFGGEFFFVLFVVLMFCLGVGMPFVNVPGMTLIQQYVEPQLHGRVFSLMQIISTAAVPLGSLIYGPIADAVNIEYIFMAVGVLLVLLSLWIAKSKRIKTFEAKSIENGLKVTAQPTTEEKPTESGIDSLTI